MKKYIGQRNDNVENNHKNFMFASYGPKYT